MYTQAQVAAAIDHAVLKPELTETELVAAAAMCRRRGVGVLCVRSGDTAAAVQALGTAACRVCAVIGFPHGACRSEVKAFEARLAIADGAAELDMVMNIGQFRSGAIGHVRRDMEAVVSEAHPHGVIVKVILETALLAPAEITAACRVAAAARADYVKTSTGFSGGGATPEAVAIMLAAVGRTLKVKASGGIRNWQTAVAYLEQGCARLGVGATEVVLDGAESQDNP